jgi:hypothetical protein
MLPVKFNALESKFNCVRKFSLRVLKLYNCCVKEKFLYRLRKKIPVFPLTCSKILGSLRKEKDFIFKKYF